ERIGTVGVARELGALPGGDVGVELALEFGYVAAKAVDVGGAEAVVGTAQVLDVFFEIFEGAVLGREGHLGLRGLSLMGKSVLAKAQRGKGDKEREKDGKTRDGLVGGGAGFGGFVVADGGVAQEVADAI